MWSSGWKKATEKIEPKDTTYPTVLKEAVMLTAIIDVLKGKDVAVVEIPGAYLIADMDDEFRGTLTEMIVASAPVLYRPFMSYET